MRILCVCPSIRPASLIHMLDTFTKTYSKHTNIIINYEIRPITEIFNKVFEEHPDYDFYMMINDDLQFNTPLWDLELAKKGKICYGDDGFQHENLPTFPMIDGDIVRALGWLQMPTLTKFYGDNCWQIIGKALNILEYHPEVHIEHLWDYKGVDTATLEHDRAKFAEWLPVSHRDINKIRKVLV